MFFQKIVWLKSRGITKKLCKDESGMIPILLIIDLEVNNYIFCPNLCLKEVGLTGQKKLNDLTATVWKP